MNKKEIEDITYEIAMFFELLDALTGADMAEVVANEAINIFERLLDTYPKLKEKYDWWREPQ